MNFHLEALLKAYDAVLEAPTVEEMKRLRAIYETRLDEISRELGISKQALHTGIRIRHGTWVKAAKKPSTLPPKA